MQFACLVKPLPEGKIRNVVTIILSIWRCKLLDLDYLPGLYISRVTTRRSTKQRDQPQLPSGRIPPRRRQILPGRPAQTQALFDLPNFLRTPKVVCPNCESIQRLADRSTDNVAALVWGEEGKQGESVSCLRTPYLVNVTRHFTPAGMSPLGLGRSRRMPKVPLAESTTLSTMRTVALNVPFSGGSATTSALAPLRMLP